VFALRQQYSPAEQLLQQAMATQPGNWRAINDYGTYLFSRGRYREAADSYRQVVALDPGNHQARTNLGAALTMAGDFESGKEVYEQALEIAEFRTAYSNLGVVYYYLGDFEQSVATHRKAVELAPEESVKWLNLADALHFAGRHEEASEAFQRARELADARIAVDPNDIDTMFTYAWACQMLGDKPAAERAVRRWREIAPDDPYGLYYAGLIAASNGAREAALESLGAAVENGYPPRMLEAEPYLGDLRSDPAFGAMIAGSP
jgi:serine/threonine-protein kinase